MGPKYNYDAKTAPLCRTLREDRYEDNKRDRMLGRKYIEKIEHILDGMGVEYQEEEDSIYPIKLRVDDASALEYKLRKMGWKDGEIPDFDGDCICVPSGMDWTKKVGGLNTISDENPIYEMVKRVVKLTLNEMSSNMMYRASDKVDKLNRHKECR